MTTKIWNGRNQNYHYPLIVPNMMFKGSIYSNKTPFRLWVVGGV